MVKRLKFSGDLKFASITGQLVARAARLRSLPEALIAVPLHPNRLAGRGFNQAELLARELSASLSLPLLDNAVMRVKDQPAQTQLNAAQREENLVGAFRAQIRVPGQHVGIVDDVVTTGATARAVAAQLRRAGASQITLLAIARTP
jgi:ComF family protein